ncbi:hypothetical protein BDR04DRAFT_1094615, partial [Suillus decipiens]
APSGGGCFHITRVMWHALPVFYKVEMGVIHCGGKTRRATTGSERNGIQTEIRHADPTNQI